MILNFLLQRFGSVRYLPYLCLIIMETKVYVLKDPTTNKVRYVGITTKELSERLKGHIWDVKARPDLNYHKITWIRSLQKGGHIPVIEEIARFDTIEEAKQYEMDYIAKYRDEYDLTNCTIGGDHPGFRTHSRESILKKDTIRPVIQYNVYGEKIAEYEITEDAGRALGLKCCSHITSCCKGTRKYAYGYIWRYKGDPLGDISNINKQGLAFCDLVQYDMDGNEVARYDSYKKASAAVGDHSKGANIYAAATGGQSTCKGYKWKLEYKLERGSL